MRKIRIAWLLLLALLLVGCNDGAAEAEQLVARELGSGISLSLPESWELLSDTEDSAVIVDGDNTLSLAVVRELAGFSYYSADGLADLGEEALAAALDNMEILERESLRHPDNAVLVTASGDLADGAAVGQAVVISPVPAVRYFILVSAQSDTFAARRDLLREIYASFELILSEDELYQQFPE